MSPEKQSAYNSHFAVEVMKSGKSTAIEPDDLHTDRSYANCGLIDGKGDDGPRKPLNRPSLVDKSLKGMKNIFKMAKTGEYNSAKRDAKNRKLQSRPIDHQSVELGLKLENEDSNPFE